MSIFNKLALCAALAAGLAAPAAHADVISFAGYTTGDTGLSSLTIGIGTFSITGGTVFAYAPGAFGAFTTSGGLCALSSGSCQTDWSLAFSSAVTNFAFEADFYNDFDSVVVTAFNGAAMVGSVAVGANGSYSFGGATITSLTFNDSSSGAGFGFGDFSFDLAASGVPAPATLALVGLGLLAVGASRRFRAG